jgi:hypothetical protein
MSGKARIGMSTVLHHLIIQGIERKKTFEDELDRNNLDRYL